MRLTLLKCGTYPDPEADKCKHTFTYSLYPHAGDFRAAGTIQQAYLLNQPMTAYRVPKQNGALPDRFSLLSVDRRNIIIETVKKAEDSGAVIVRLYEAYNQRSTVTLTAGFDVQKASICDLLENEAESLTVEDNKITFPVKPFEIVTLKLER